MPDFARIYARQEYMTPGASETVGIIAETVNPNEETILVDIASGKGEAATWLASHYACQVLCVEPYDPFVHYSTAKFWHFNLRDLVTLVRADGGRLPIGDAAADAVYCIGAPSIVGLERCLSEMARVVRPGGVVIASDITWREKPGELGVDWGDLKNFPQTAVDEYVGAIESTGLILDRTHTHQRSVWEDYFAPMLAVAEEARTATEDKAADVFLADEIERMVESERRAADLWLDYTTFLARKPG